MYKIFKIIVLTVNCVIFLVNYIIFLLDQNRLYVTEYFVKNLINDIINKWLVKGSSKVRVSKEDKYIRILKEL